MAINITKRKEVEVQESIGMTFANLIVSKRHLPFQMEHSHFKHVRHDVSRVVHSVSSILIIELVEVAVSEYSLK